MNSLTGIFSVLLLLGVTQAFAGKESMESMPILKSKSTFIVKNSNHGEDLQDQRGFGEKESEVRMMNLMMVEGSGYEGMDMAQMSMSEIKPDHSMNMAQAETPTPQSPKAQESNNQYDLKFTPNPVKVGSNELIISISDTKTKAPQKGLKPKAKVYMTSMDMGTEEPRVREIAPGKYQLKANFTMKGPWAVKLILPKEEKVFDVNVGANQ